MKYIGILFATMLVLIACETKPKSWQYSKTVTIDGVNPLGITETGDGIWLSDRDHDRLIRIDKDGNNLETRNGIEQPMHLTSDGHILYVPSYRSNVVLIDKGNLMKQVLLKDSLNGPSGVWKEDDAIAITDFNNHRVLFAENGVDYISIGKEGTGKGELFHPTDVQITDDAIWVADSENNRVQVFQRNGDFLRAIGVGQSMDGVRGLFVTKTSVFVTDYTNSRVLIFSHMGELQQEISEGITWPTDLIVSKRQLCIANYGDSSVAIYDLKKISEE